MTRSKVYLILQSLLCVALAVWMIAAVNLLFREGMALKEADPLAWIFTREKVGDRFAIIAPVFFIAVGTTLAGLILGIRDEKEDQPVKVVQAELELLRSRVRQPSEEMKAAARKQKTYGIAGAAVFGVCMIPVLIYVTRLDHFPEDQLESMFRGLLWGIVPWTALGLAALLVFGLMRDRAAREEIAAAKARIAQEKEEKTEAGPPAAKGKNEERTVLAVRIILLIVAAALLIAGVLNGGIRDVLIKAINLCTECVGLG